MAALGVGKRTTIELSGGPVEVDVHVGVPDEPTLVFLHEGLGSIDLWRSFPDDVVDRLAGVGCVLYSRHGYGRSGPATMPRPVGYMHHEADVVLPALLEHLSIERPVLVGHSDGASIALLHAGAGYPVAGLVCIAPHVFVEPESVAGIEAARAAFEATDMAARMARYHDDPVATFRGWNDVWRSPEFRDWNIEDRLSRIAAPVLTIQGGDDQYGTVAQLDAIESGVGGPCERFWLDDAGHAPHLDAPAPVAARVEAFVRDL